MKFRRFWKHIVPMALIGLLSLDVCAGWFGLGADSWKEEILLHDGRKIIVERLQTYGGSSEIGQPSSVKEHELRFVMPNSGRTMTWKSPYAEELGRTNFNVLALHAMGGTPYLIVEPNLCLSYNKWGRPNPPYVIFKHDGKAWQQIAIAELPPEFKQINMVVNNGRKRDIENAMVGTGYIPAQKIAEINSSLSQPKYKSILRTPVASMGQECRVEFSNGKGGWLSADWFSDEKDLAACLRVCERKDFVGTACPCSQFFKGN